VEGKSSPKRGKKPVKKPAQQTAKNYQVNWSALMKSGRGQWASCRTKSYKGFMTGAVSLSSLSRTPCSLLLSAELIR